MLLSLAGSATLFPTQTPVRAPMSVSPDTNTVVHLRPTTTPPATPSLTTATVLPTNAPQEAHHSRHIPLSPDYTPLLQAQARTERDAILKRAAMQAANQTFQSAIRGYQEAISQKDVATLRNGIVTLTLRSETEARIAQQLYERYQAARAIGATEEELAELESRFARIAGWPPLPPVRADRAPGGSLRGLSDAIATLKNQISSLTTS